MENLYLASCFSVQLYVKLYNSINNFKTEMVKMYLTQKNKKQNFKTNIKLVLIKWGTFTDFSCKNYECKETK